ncbi:hypothetical protein Tco_0204304 [Tanacetum coccineum]
MEDSEKISQIGGSWCPISREESTKVLKSSFFMEIRLPHYEIKPNIVRLIMMTFKQLRVYEDELKVFSGDFGVITVVELIVHYSCDHDIVTLSQPKTSPNFNNEDFQQWNRKEGMGKRNVGILKEGVVFTMEWMGIGKGGYSFRRREAEGRGEMERYLWRGVEDFRDLSRRGGEVEWIYFGFLLGIEGGDWEEGRGKESDVRRHVVFFDVKVKKSQKRAFCREKCRMEGVKEEDLWCQWRGECTFFFLHNKWSLIKVLVAQDVLGGLPKGNTSGSAEDSVQLKELMVLVPKLVTRINSLEKELKDTKQTLGNAVIKLVKKVKTLETALKRKSKKVLISESAGEESEDQGRKFQDIDDDPLVSLVRESMKEKSTDFVTPTKASGEAQEEEISPTILEAAKTLSKVASQGVGKEKSTDKGKRYRRRARSMAKKIDTGLDAEEEINTGREEINTGIEEVSTGSTKVDSGTASKRGQREGKAPMVEDDIQATHKTKEQMRQEEAGLEEAIKLQAQLDEEVAKQIHFDKMVAQRMAEEEALSEQQKKRKAQVQFEAQFYTEEDWDTIRAKLEANAELSKDVLGQDLPEQDFAKRMVDMVNQRKKHFAEERAKAKRNKPMTQSQLRIYMSNYLKNQGTWKLSQLKKLKFEEIKEEFDKLVQQIDTFVLINLEATKAKLKRYGEEL